MCPLPWLLLLKRKTILRGEDECIAQARVRVYFCHHRAKIVECQPWWISTLMFYLHLVVRVGPRRDRIQIYLSRFPCEWDCWSLKIFPLEIGLHLCPWHLRWLNVYFLLEKTRPVKISFSKTLCRSSQMLWRVLGPRFESHSRHTFLWYCNRY